ncbi:MAG: hypothetical protein AABX70_05650 [Nanoarchaeota archaeon]
MNRGQSALEFLMHRNHRISGPEESKILRVRNAPFLCLKKSRGQSALEFLMTYGWAILIILIGISALTYFGVLSPSRLLPARCMFSPEVSCEEFKIEAPSTVAFKFKNNLGFAADFSSISANSTEFGSCAGSPVTLGAGQITEVTCSLTPGGIPSSEKIKVQIYMSYKKLGGSYNVPIQGEMYGTSN